MGKEILNPYYRLSLAESCCDRILEEFGLPKEAPTSSTAMSPSSPRRGRAPSRGAASCWSSTALLPGYQHHRHRRVHPHLQLLGHAHRLPPAFCGRKEAIEENKDIANSSQVFERMESRLKIAQTDIGRKLQAQSDDLRNLVEAFKAGAVLEDHRE